ncbi:MAG TPA: aspartyl/asparaginyl beta-hydroxylase domain-containing protein, partial [Thermoanaerobaculia bacterium]|nr:aspartyl/asparaginyl beta-hydroxylase domain-containing protein [Thermoanaerobaculia bacterium]
MRTDLAHLEGAAWIDHFVKQNYEGTWSILPLRAPAGATHPIQTTYSDPANDDYADTPVLDACPAFRAALEQFRCELLAVRLMKLTPGSEIKTHSDHDLSVEERRVRLHIPIATNPDVEFRLNDRRVVMAEGECWYLRLSDPHAVANRGATDRVHLVIDAVVNDWLENMLLKAEEGGAAGDPARGILDFGF